MATVLPDRKKFAVNAGEDALFYQRATGWRKKFSIADVVSVGESCISDDVVHRNDKL